MKNTSIYSLLAGCSIATLMAFSSAANAQTAPQTASTQKTATAEDTGGVGEIIVTAQKREERLSNVGMAISAFGGEALRDRGITSAADLPQVVPGLTFSRSAYGPPIYTLRGIGFYETSLAAYPAVTVYNDQAPLAFPFLTSHTGLDLERVEVLKGPQGILFGQNSTGGAINFVANKPTDTLHYGAEIGFGRFNRARAEAFVSGPLSSTLKGRIAASIDQGGDWQRSYTRNDTLGKTRTYQGRLILDWEPSDGAKFELNVNGWIDKSDPQAPQLFITHPQLGGYPLIALNYPLSPQTPRAADWGTGVDRPKGDQNQFQTSLRAEIALGDDLSLTSLSSYVRARRNDLLDNDGTSLTIFQLSQIGEIDTLFQELRIANDPSNPIRFTLGGNYDRSKVFDNGVLTSPLSSAAATFGFLSNGQVSTQRVRSGAVFGNIDADLASNLVLKVGGRYTKTKRTDDGCTYDSGDGTLAATFTFLSTLFSGTPTPAIAPGACTSLNPVTFKPERYTGTLDEHNFSWRVGLDYKPTDNVLLYANVAKGYKAGSFPVAPASINSQYFPVTQESVLDFDVGFKAQLLDRKLSLEGSAFYYDYTDKQLRGKVLDVTFGPLDNLQNIPKSSVKGAELSAILAPVEGVRLNGNVTYLDAKVDKYTGVSGTGVLRDFKGTQIPLAPRWSAAGGAEYEWGLSSSLRASLGANVSYNGSTFSVLGEDPDSRIKAYTLVDLRAGITSDSGWGAQVWVKNLADTYYWTNAIFVFDQSIRFAGQPRTFGITLRYTH